MVAKVFPHLTRRSGRLKGVAHEVMDTLPDWREETTVDGMDFLRHQQMPQIV